MRWWSWANGFDSSQDHVVPFLMTNTDKTFEDGLNNDTWPPFPWIANLIFRWIYVPRHKGAWRFSPCDVYGQPKELPFA